MLVARQAIFKGENMIDNKFFEGWDDIIRELGTGTFSTTVGTYPHSRINENEYMVELPLVGISKDELSIDAELIKEIGRAHV